MSWAGYESLFLVSGESGTCVDSVYPEFIVTNAAANNAVYLDNYVMKQRWPSKVKKKCVGEGLQGKDSGRKQKEKKNIKQDASLP